LTTYSNNTVVLLDQGVSNPITIKCTSTIHCTTTSQLGVPMIFGHSIVQVEVNYKYSLVLQYKGVLYKKRVRRGTVPGIGKIEVLNVLVGVL